jgi:hypothetical protein
MQTATHCFMSFGLYGVYSLFAQFPIEPVTSLLSGVQQVNAMAATAIANTARMLTASLVQLFAAIKAHAKRPVTMARDH